MLLLPAIATLANALASKIVQSGSFNGVPVGTYPIYDLGIHGEGEIIGVGASGLDTRHCFFANAPGDTAFSQTYGPSHRKVVAYRSYADGMASGMQDPGTHMVGTVLGECTVPGHASNEAGVAYKAKVRAARHLITHAVASSYHHRAPLHTGGAPQVSFTDVGLASGEEVAPNNLVEDYYSIDFANGARIFLVGFDSSSNGTYYTASAAETDRFMAKQSSALIVSPPRATLARSTCSRTPHYALGSHAPWNHLPCQCRSQPWVTRVTQAWAAFVLWPHAKTA